MESQEIGHIIGEGDKLQKTRASNGEHSLRRIRSAPSRLETEAHNAAYQLATLQGIYGTGGGEYSRSVPTLRADRDEVSEPSSSKREKMAEVDSARSDADRIESLISVVRKVRESIQTKERNPPTSSKREKMAEVDSTRSDADRIESLISMIREIRGSIPTEQRDSPSFRVKAEEAKELLPGQTPSDTDLHSKERSSSERSSGVDPEIIASLNEIWHDATISQPNSSEKRESQEWSPPRSFDIGGEMPRPVEVNESYRNFVRRAVSESIDLRRTSSTKEKDLEILQKLSEKEYFSSENLRILEALWEEQDTLRGQLPMLRELSNKVEDDLEDFQEKPLQFRRQSPTGEDPPPSLTESPLDKSLDKAVDKAFDKRIERLLAIEEIHQAR